MKPRKRTELTPSGNVQCSRRYFAGDHANLNYLIHLDGKPAVLRRSPLGELPAGAYDMTREFRILSCPRLVWR